MRLGLEIFVLEDLSVEITYHLFHISSEEVSIDVDVNNVNLNQKQ
jgi:hypothetical protein